MTGPRRFAETRFHCANDLPGFPRIQRVAVRPGEQPSLRFEQSQNVPFHIQLIYHGNAYLEVRDVTLKRVE